MMDCVSCGLQAGYNRVVVELVHDERLGGFCRNCEFDEFGRTLSQFATDDATCVLCNRDGLYAIPAWEPYEKATEDRVTFAVDFTIRDRTPRLCDEHFDELGHDDSGATNARRSVR